MTTRTISLGLHLLDRQLLDRHRRQAGKVDDVELADDGSGGLVVTGLYCGRGALARRLGLGRFGAWLAAVGTATAPGLTGLVPVDDIAVIGAAVELRVDRDGLAPHAGEQWARDRVIGRIPASAHDPEPNGSKDGA